MDRFHDERQDRADASPEAPSGGERSARELGRHPAHRRTSFLVRAAMAARPVWYGAAVGLLVLGIHGLALRVGSASASPRVQYGLRAAILVVAAVAAAAMWWARRRGRVWDADLLPALMGGLGALTILTALNGTPFDLYGLQGDQHFRTEYVTRFADDWRGADYTYRGLPAYYAPTYFWLLGRAADLGGIEPYHMLKYGTIAVVFLAPIASYLLWRQIVSPRVAALISVALLIVPTLNETYAWIVLVAFVPWWLLVGHNVGRPGVRRWHPVVLGLVGAVLFTTYYYYFFIIPLALAGEAVVARARDRLAWRQIGRNVGRTFTILGVAALGSAVYWAPLAWNFVTAEDFTPLNNRWLTVHSGTLALPMLEPSVLGALCLAGLVFLVATVKEALPRAMTVLLVSLFIWHAVGYVAALIDMPLMSFRMREMVPILMLAAAMMAAARVAALAAPHVSRDVIWRFAATGVMLLVVLAGNHFVNLVLDQSRTAHNQTLPSGTLPSGSLPNPGSTAPAPTPPETLRTIIDARYQGDGHPVVLTSRADLLAYYPYYGFVQWNANYSHPTAQFRGRIDFLTELARAGSPLEFAERLDNNRYDRIDVLVLPYDGGTLTFRYWDDAFPYGTVGRDILIPRFLVTTDYFAISLAGDMLVAVRQRP